MILMRLLHGKGIQRSILYSGGILLLLGLLLTGCGASASGTAAGSSMAALPQSAHSVSQSSGSASGQSSNSSTSATNATSASPVQYLVKTLNVNIAVKDPRKAASSLQSWISTTDRNTTSAGMNYQQVGNNLYNVTLSFAVSAATYPQVENYLASYANQNGGRLISLDETVQDVTNDYVDSQSRLANLKVEQQRLQTLMSQAQSLNDILTIQDKLTSVEGQIEQTEEHLKNLSNETTYYTVTIQLQPLVIATPPPQPAPQGWSIGQVFHDAFAASLAFAQGLLTLMVWLLAFAIYLIPVVLIVWGAYRWRGRLRHAMPPPLMHVTPPPAE